MPASHVLDAVMLTSVLAATVRLATPVLLAALGEMLAERGGVYNMGLEGTMLMGAFTAYLVAFDTGSPWVGVLAAAATGGMMSLLFAFVAVTMRVEQIVAGLALNLLGAGLSTYWLRTAFAGGQAPVIPFLEAVSIPILNRIPVLGPVLFGQKALSYLALLAVPTLWFFLYRTRPGLELRCIGENPAALDTKGLSVAIRQYMAVVFGGLMAGLGGAFLSVGSTARFVPDMTNGRGWLAIVVVIAGAWHPAGILLATLLFSFLDALQLQIQGVGSDVPYQLLLAAPYVVAILALMFRRGRSRAPTMLGMPYVRE